MTQLETIFYTMGIIYMAINSILLLGIGIGIFFIVRAILDIHRLINKKIKNVEEIMKHPEDAVAKVSMSLIKLGFESIKKAFTQKHKKNPTS